jgi:Ion channel
LAAVISYFVSIILVIIGHFADIILWTYALIPLNIFVTNPDAFYFAGEMYVTLGFGSFELERNWRILPIVIAFTGIFAASMSGAALFSMLSSLIDKSRINDAKDSST